MYFDFDKAPKNHHIKRFFQFPVLALLRRKTERLNSGSTATFFGNSQN